MLAIEGFGIGGELQASTVGVGPDNVALSWGKSGVFHSVAAFGAPWSSIVLPPIVGLSSSLNSTK